MKINSSEDLELKGWLEVTVTGYNPMRAVVIKRDTPDDWEEQECYAVELIEQTKEGTWKKLDATGQVFDLSEALGIAEVLVLEAKRVEISMADILIMRENARMMAENAQALFEKARKRYDDIKVNVVVTDTQAIDTARRHFVTARYLKNCAEKLLHELETQTEF